MVTSPGLGVLGEKITEAHTKIIPIKMALLNSMKNKTAVNADDRRAWRCSGGRQRALRCSR